MAAPRRRAIRGGAAALVVAALGSACAGPPLDAARLRAENELLREQLEIIKRNCSYYRDLELEADDEGE